MAFAPETPATADPLRNPAAEQALLGALLLENRAYSQVCALVGATDFAVPAHGRIFAAIGDLVSRGVAANPLTLQGQFENDPALADLGGARYLMTLAESAVTVLNGKDYAETIADLTRRREIVAAAEDLIVDARAPRIDRKASDLIEDFARKLGDDGAPEALAPLLAPIDPAALEGEPVPGRQWLVPDWIPMQRVTALYGAGGEGKTTLAQMLATAAALGMDWLGLPVQACNSLLFFCEDDVEEMQRRQAAINSAFGCTFADLPAMRWAPRLGGDNALMVFDGGKGRLTPLFHRLVKTAQEHEVKLIILDTLADVFVGNENDRAQARAFAQSALGRLARETGGAVLLLAHPSLSGIASGTGDSGSTGWKGTYRSKLFLSSPKADEGDAPDPDARILERGKANFARRGETIEIRWREGVFVRTGPPSGIIGSIERRTAERVFLDLLAKTVAEGQPVSSNPRAGNYAPRLFMRRPKESRGGFRAADLERAMQALFEKREIVNAPYGRKGDERTKIALRERKQ